MPNQRDIDCKCNNIKVDTNIEKNNKAKTKNWSKSKNNTKKKTPKKIDNNLLNQYKYNNYNINKL